MRAAASRSRREWDHVKLRACRVVALCNVQLSARDARLTNKGAVMGEAAVLVSRRTARQATHCVPAGRLRDDGYLGPGTRKTDASVLGR